MSADRVAFPSFGSGGAAGPTLPRLDANTQRYYAEQYVGRAVSDVGLTSGDDYYAWLQRQQLGVTRDIARNVWKEYGVSTHWAEQIRHLPPNVGIPRAWYSETHSEYIDNYGYKFNVSYIDSLSGESRSTDFFIKSSTRMSKGEQEADIKSRFEEGTGDIQGTATEIERGALYHKVGSKW